MKTLLEQSGMANLNLRAKELEVMEQITVGAIESDEARNILESIPKLDQIVPLPSGKAQLKELISGLQVPEDEDEYAEY